MGVGLAVVGFILLMINFAVTRPDEFKKMTDQLSENSYRRRKRS